MQRDSARSADILNDNKDRSVHAGLGARGSEPSSEAHEAEEKVFFYYAVYEQQNSAPSCDVAIKVTKPSRLALSDVVQHPASG